MKMLLNINMSGILLYKLASGFIYVRTGFDLNPEQEWIQAHKAQTINL